MYIAEISFLGIRILTNYKQVMAELYNFLVPLVFFIAAIVFIILFFVSAPYGKFLRKGWGPVLRSKWAWMLMEFPSPALMVIFFITSGSFGIPGFVFLSIWLVHYLHRTFIYPFRQPGKEKDFPAVVALMAFVFNCINGTINGYGVFHHYSYDLSYLVSGKFISGIALFAAGFIINKLSDEKLRNLRKQSPDKYVLPAGGLFNYVSNPHYFGEILEWAGWAIATWSLPGLAFFVFTFANLFPRAVASHIWYKSHFSDFPENRKAIIPFIL